MYFPEVYGYRLPPSLRYHLHNSQTQTQTHTQNTFFFQRFSHESMRELKNYHLSSKPTPLWTKKRDKLTQVDSRSRDEKDEK